MRRLLLGLCLLAACTGPSTLKDPADSSSPEACDDREVTYTVESLIELTTPIDSLQRLVRYPEEALEAGVEGRVFVKVLVDASGAVTDAEVIRGLGYGLDEEAVRIARQARFHWLIDHCDVPGQVKTALPVIFILSERKK